MEGCGRPGEQGGMDQPNPEIRDDSYLNNVGGMNSEQPGEEANWAKQYRPPPCLNQRGPRALPSTLNSKGHWQSIILF